MSSSPFLIFDTSIILALINRESSEKEAADQCVEHISKLPHSARLLVTPCMTELVYKTNHRLSGSGLLQNLNHFSIRLFPIRETLERDVFEKFCLLTNAGEYDYADFFMGAVGIELRNSQILTLDRKDLPLALARAQQAFPVGSRVQLVPFPH